VRLASVLTRGMAVAVVAAGVALMFGLSQTWTQGASTPQQASTQAIDGGAVDEASAVPILARAINEAPSPGGPQEGIQVHGQWTIEVRNPDGTMASHHDFENALHSTGATALSKLLARSVSVGQWEVYLEGGSNACMYNSSLATPCLLLEPSAAAPPAGYGFNTLIVSSPPYPDPDAGKLVLRGTATAQANGNISTVYTYLNTCLSNNAPANPCVWGGSFWPGGNAMTQASISPISVQTGQQVLVTVKISFS